MAGIKAGLISYFAGNPVAANLLMAGVAVIGLLAGATLVVRDVPLNVPHIVEVAVESPGSSAREVEEDIVRRVEEAVIGISGVERVLGTAAADRGTILVEYSPLSDGDAVLHDVENAVDGIDNFPPPNAKEPEIEPVRFKVTALTVAVSSAHLSQESLQRTAEHIRGELLRLPGISDVSLRGARDREVSIELDEEQLRRLRALFRDDRHPRAALFAQPVVRGARYGIRDRWRCTWCPSGSAERSSRTSPWSRTPTARSSGWATSRRFGTPSRRTTGWS